MHRPVPCFQVAQRLFFSQTMWILIYLDLILCPGCDWEQSRCWASGESEYLFNWHKLRREDVTGRCLVRRFVMISGLFTFAKFEAGLQNCNYGDLRWLRWKRPKEAHVFLNYSHTSAARRGFSTGLNLILAPWLSDLFIITTAWQIFDLSMMNFVIFLWGEEKQGQGYLHPACVFDTRDVNTCCNSGQDRADCLDCIAECHCSCQVIDYAHCYSRLVLKILSVWCLLLWCWLSRSLQNAFSAGHLDRLVFHSHSRVNLSSTRLPK